jgi:hypothetical protein
MPEQTVIFCLVVFGISLTADTKVVSTKSFRAVVTVFCVDLRSKAAET